ncbi:hypothetical protein EFN43_02155 [Pediococcus pentosaceus]|uniref:hypothetical protein n=1 Tax=Pediococcus pentosaceus TaxID=1255 RepID=UPI0021A8F2F7|nr:hypothetical protein [Pediococcus pentosaceus]MCT3019890.1 hypothetical protein [Pediococcus pentosaceus]
MVKLNSKIVTGSTVALTAIQLLMPLSASAATNINATSSSSNQTEKVATSTSSLSSATSADLAQKFGLDKSTNLVKSNKVQRGDSVTFDNFFVVGNDSQIKSLSLVDPLNENFSYDSARVLLSQPIDEDTKATVDSNSSSTASSSSTDDKSTQSKFNADDPQNYKAVDVSKTGKFTFDKDKHTISWSADKPSQYFGQMVDLQVTVKVNADTNLDDIPNQSYMLKNDDKTQTDKVHVTVDGKETPAPENHTPKTATTKTAAASTPAPVTKYAKQGSLPQTMQKIAKQFWPLILAGVALFGAGSIYLLKSLKNKEAKK